MNTSYHSHTYVQSDGRADLLPGPLSKWIQSHHNKSPAGKENVNLRNLIPMECLAGQTCDMKTHRTCGNPRPYRQDRSLPIPEQS